MNKLQKAVARRVARDSYLQSLGHAHGYSSWIDEVSNNLKIEL